MTAIVVSGFGRCGSSLVMQMLAAGGVPCIGDYPAFEGRDAVQPGQAVKILDPHRPDPIPYEIPAGARVIWVERDAHEQIASHDKFLRALTGLGYDRASRRRAVASIAKDRAAGMRAIAGRPLLVLRFEDVLAHPEHEALRIGLFVGVPFDSQRAARQVLHRGPRCEPDMAIELRLMARRAEAA